MGTAIAAKLQQQEAHYQSQAQQALGQGREDLARLALQRRAAIGPQLAFVTYLGVVDNWRKLPFHDPGLPREVLAADWSAPAAGALFQKLVAILEGRALGHAAGYWPTAG